MRRTSITMTTFNTSLFLGVMRDDSLNTVLVETSTDLEQVMSNKENASQNQLPDQFQILKVYLNTI